MSGTPQPSRPITRSQTQSVSQSVNPLVIKRDSPLKNLSPEVQSALSTLMSEFGINSGPTDAPAMSAVVTDEQGDGELGSPSDLLVGHPEQPQGDNGGPTNVSDPRYEELANEYRKLSNLYERMLKQLCSRLLH